jgi:ubiquinone/menaquinone biosynthesis C-methylase UbiE
VAVKSAEHAQQTYDRVAAAYDDLWVHHVAEPNAKLTKGMSLKRGERVADLACGTGAFTLDMARIVAPGEMVGVDYSQGMLDAAQERVQGEGVRCTWVHSKAEDFALAVRPESFDAVSVRFILAYVDWHHFLPSLGRMVGPGGRVAVLTSLSNSIPQATAIYQQFMGAFGETDVIVAPVPEKVEQVADLLAQGGLTPIDTWTYRVRLWFADGLQATSWLKESGYATHPSLGEVAPEALQMIEQIFAAGLEANREAQGIPLDLFVAGVIAVRR